MGAGKSTEEKNEASILRRPEQGEASALYWACRNGDIDTVQKLTASIPYADINCLEPNGSTALHAASFFGHANVVRLLLHQYGVMRHRRNRHGLTAYEEADTDEIHLLFHRSPNSRRFCGDVATDDRYLFTWSIDKQTEDKDDNDEAPSDWLQELNKETMTRYNQVAANIGKTMATSSIIRSLIPRIMHCMDQPGLAYNESKAATDVQRLINEHVTPANSEYQKACELVSKYVRTKKVEHLLRLHSLETPFYKVRGKDGVDHCFRLLLFYKLDTLYKRAYQGRSFRGLTMTHSDLRTYQWALKHKGSIVITDNFCSTSVDKNAARGSVDTSSPDTIHVLMVFTFPEKCDTAIQLFRLSDTLPSISDFDDEREVLILPMTSFRIINIDTGKTSGQHTIYLENVPTEGGLFALLKVIWKYRGETFEQ
ncbi:unnamed protein product [Rotaria sp. Silwood2]|nr:unnamed protein product [Rotaria sp. Silwood2]CAF2861375.1 unnamed protein product [Rotaria sp. Silwood2]CAF4173865.1 unnamed protein product [Rotaria sp. Silwood2]CAF4410847.1 unnamed protein product [Rotaria sp. Silwood2]